MAHQLKFIRVKGYKSISDQTIALSAMNVLIGQNGAGKSNFIALFKFLRNIIERRLRNISIKAGSENLLYYGSKITKEIFLELNFDPNYYQLKLQPANDDSLFIAVESCGFRGSNYSQPYLESISHDEKESNLQDQAKKNYKLAGHVYDVLRNWRVYHFHDTSESASIKKYASMADNKFLFEDASNLAPFLYTLKESQGAYYERIVKTVQLVIPFFEDFILQPNPSNVENIRLEWMDRYSDKTFTANELSDGSLRFICVATLLLQKNLPKVILLDEPELGLHPSAVTILAGLLKKASQRTQVIISTQSTSLVNEFDAEDIIVVEKKEAESTFKRLEAEKLENWLNEYSLGELWDKNVIGGKP